MHICEKTVRSPSHTYTDTYTRYFTSKQVRRAFGPIRGFVCPHPFLGDLHSINRINLIRRRFWITSNFPGDILAREADRFRRVTRCGVKCYRDTFYCHYFIIHIFSLIPMCDFGFCTYFYSVCLISYHSIFDVSAIDTLPSAFVGRIISSHRESRGQSIILCVNDFLARRARSRNWNIWFPSIAFTNFAEYRRIFLFWFTAALNVLIIETQKCQIRGIYGEFCGSTRLRYNSNRGEWKLLRRIRLIYNLFARSLAVITRWQYSMFIVTRIK